jgi:hypothetical protein
MKNYKSLNELRNSITKQVSSKDGISMSFLRANEIFIEIETKLIGDAENTLFLRIYSWMQKKAFLNYTIYILLPQDFERFSSVFISTLYLFNQGIKSQFVILGHKDNSRTYEFTHLAHSGLLSQKDLNFFTVASYLSESGPLFEFGMSNTEAVDKYVVSGKNLPLISIDSNNFDFYFKKSFIDLFDNYIPIDEKDPYNTLMNSLSSLPVSQLRKPYVQLHFYKLLDNLNCLYRFYRLIHKKEVKLPPYEKKLENFITNILYQPIYQVFILLALLSDKIIRKRYLEIHKTIKQTEVNSANKTLVRTDNKEILSQYLAFLEEQNEMARNLYNGIYELAKNTVEHASTKKGILTAKIIKQQNLIKLRNNSSEHDLWQGYFQSVQKNDFADNENKMYLDISIVDSGIIGIFETTLKNTNNNWRGISDETNNADREKLEEGLRGFQNSKEKETEYLFNLYFQPKSPVLSRQKNKAEQSFGIKLFTEFVTKNSGIFTVKTNKYASENETISFSLYNLCKSDDSYKCNDSDSPFGTAYNIAVPIRKFIKKKEEDFNRRGAGVSKAIFEKMLKMEIAESNRLPLDYIHNTFSSAEKHYIKEKGEEFNDKNQIAVYSLKTDRDIDISNFVREFSRYSEDNKQECKAVIIENINEEAIKSIVEILYKTEKKLISYEKECNNLFRQQLNLSGKIVILMSHKRNKDRNDKIAILGGNTYNDYLSLNKFIIQNNANIEYQFINEGSDDYKKTYLNQNDEKQIKEILINNPLFINGTCMLPTDLFKKEKDVITEFEKKAKRRLLNSIDEDGYNWKNAHLKISSKLHLKDFIYGKKLFQRSRYASEFAFLLSKDILKSIQEKNDIEVCYTLIGYGYYSELLVSQTCEFIKICIEHNKKYNKNWSKELKVEYVIVKDEEEMNFSRYFQNLKFRNENIKEQLIVVVPISSTLTTCLKIENSLTKPLIEKIHELKKSTKPEDIKWKEKLESVQKQNDVEKLFVQPFYTVVVVGNYSNFENLVKEWDYPIESIKNQDDAIAMKVLKKSKVWKKVKKDRIIITENRENREKKEKKDSERQNKFNIYIKSEWYLPKDCKLCFPENDPQKEQYLFKTDKVSVTPSLVFDKPHWYEYKNKVYFSFNDLIGPKEYPILRYDMIDWAHYKPEHKHYAYYIHYSPVVRNNEEQIEDWALKVRENPVEVGEKPVEDESNIKIGELSNVLLIAPDKSENGEFLHIINRVVFDDRANIIKFDRGSDHFVNFKKFFYNDIDQKDLSIFFVDNLMASSNTFFTLYENVINALDAEPKDGKLKVKGAFCLINRMDYICYTNVQNILGKGKKDNIFAFMQLNVPENPNPLIFCSLCNADKMWGELIKNASCDCIKRYAFDKEKQYFKEITKNNLTIQKFPYEQKDRGKTLLKIMLIHFIYKAFTDASADIIEEDITDEVKIEKAIKIVNCLDEKKTISTINFDEFVKDLKEYIILHNQTNFFEMQEEDKKFKANLIKVLVHSHLKQHRGIKIAIFGWVRDELIKVTEAILEKIQSGQPDIFNILVKNSSNIEEKKDTYHYLRALIRCGANLKIAYLLNKKFLEAMCILIDEFNETSFEDFKIYCTVHIVRSLRKNEQRSIILEKNLNELLKERNNKLPNEINKISPSTSFLELLILENTSIIRQTLSRLKEDYPKEDYPKEDEKSIKERIDELFKNDSGIDIRVRDFKDCYEENDEDIKEQLENIWELSNYLEPKKSGAKEKEIKENDAKEIVERMAKIVGYDKKGYGGLLLLKYQDINKSQKSEGNKNSESDYIVIGKTGKELKSGNNEILMDCFDFDQTNDELRDSLAVRMLEGKDYLENSQYEWTNYTVYCVGDRKWKGQNGEEINCDETRKFDENLQNEIKRILFIRIAEQKEKEDNKEEETVGKAVFVFYDTNGQSELSLMGNHFSIHKVRFAHVLRNELIRYFNSRYNDDTFRAWVKNKQKVEEFKIRYKKNAHGIYDHMGDFIKDPIIYEKPKLFRLLSDLVIGKFHNTLLENVNNYDFGGKMQDNVFLSNLFEENMQDNISLSSLFTNRFKEIIKLIIDEENKSAENTDKNRISIQWKVNDTYAGYIGMNYMKFIICSLIMNAIKYRNSDKDCLITIYNEDSSLIILNTNPKEGAADIEKINKIIKSKTPPVNSITLYVVNKYYCLHFKKDIQIIIDNDKFQVKLPLTQGETA